mmetsp:Transcript_43937/g.71211  ORF Transcript_43937/g.71211 Transcript_43937/m.71211 type:complete len:327 (-) Transcript_43937:253-1233(-)
MARRPLSKSLAPAAAFALAAACAAAVLGRSDGFLAQGSAAGRAPQGCAARHCGDLRSRSSHLALAAESEGAAPPQYELWMDFRSGRLKVPGESPFMSNQLLECPKVKEMLLDLVKGLKKKYETIGVELPKGRIVDGVIVDERFKDEVVDALKDLGLPVYLASQDVEGEKLPGNNYFVTEAASGLPVAIVSATAQIRVTKNQPSTAHEVWSIAEPEDPAVVAARKAEEEEELKKYKAGLESEDDSDYVLPPMSRLRELTGSAPEQEIRKGRLLAKTLPPEPLLWGGALMQRIKNSGVSIKYRIKFDRQAAGEEPRDPDYDPSPWGRW